MYPEAAIKIANLTFKIDSMLCWILKFHILCSLWEVRPYTIKKMSEIMITQKWFYLAMIFVSHGKQILNKYEGKKDVLIKILRQVMVIFIFWNNINFKLMK